MERADRPRDGGLQNTIDLLVVAVIGGLVRVEGAWLGAFTFIVIDNYVRDVSVPVLGGSFNTIIGLIFLAIVLVSPDGLMGVWGRLTSRGRARGGDPPVEAAPVNERRLALDLNRETREGHASDRGTRLRASLKEDCR